MKTPASRMTSVRIRVATGRTVPIPGTYGSVRAEGALEATVRVPQGEGFDAAVSEARARLHKLARQDMLRALRGELKSMGIDHKSLGRKPVREDSIRWAR